MPSYITAIGTAVPVHCFEQSQIASFMASALQMDDYNRRKLSILYRSTKIQHRHSVLQDYGKALGDFSFYPNTPDLEPFPSISARMKAFREYALPLSLQAVKDCFAKRNVTNFSEITHIITVSCTGMYAPGLDIELVTALGLPTTIERTAINFMGCYGAFNGLKVANAIVKADASAKVLLVCVELCTLHFQKSVADDHLLSNALFADGAAAVLIEGTRRESGVSLEMKSFFCDLFPEGKNDMAWNVADFGFEMTLSSYIPKLVQSGIGTLVARLLQNANLEREAITLYAMHPGGRAILEAIEKALEITPEDNRYAYSVLKNYGNMSSGTVLFVLSALMKDLQTTDSQQNILSCAFGPGLTLEAMVLGIISEQ